MNISMPLLWEWTFQGGVFIVMVLLVRALLFRQLPKRAFTVLWTAATVRLLVPVFLPAPFSLFNLLDLGGGAGAGLSQAAGAVPAAVENTVGGSWFGRLSQTITNGILGFRASDFGAAWAVGAVVCALVCLVSHRRGRRVYAMSLPADDPFVALWLGENPTRRPVSVRVSDRISAPLTYGVFHPVILLPRDMDWGDREAMAYVLAHEFQHIWRYDVMRKWALAAALCLHWFNPLVWVMYAVANRDIELDCDEEVAGCFSWGSPAGYARALIALEERRSFGSPFASHFSQSTLEARIKALMTARGKGPVRFAAAVLVVAVLAAVCGTSGSAAEVPHTEDDPAASQAVEWSYTDGEPQTSEAPLDLTSDDPVVYVDEGISAEEGEFAASEPPEAAMARLEGDVAVDTVENASWAPAPEPTVPPSAYVEPAPPTDVTEDYVYYEF